MVRDEVATGLRERIEGREALVGVVGMGYVGLPLALTFCERGFRVLGFDVDPSKVEALRAGRCYIGHIDPARVERAVKRGLLDAAAPGERLAEADALLLCVPTPLGPHREPEMRFVEETAHSVAAHLRRGQLVVLESTTYPGTTDELLRPALESGGLACGRDFFLAYSPEREDPGNERFHTGDIPKVVGGVDAVSGELAEALYRAAVRSVVRVSSARAAEATKLLENIFRSVNIALVNELKVIYDRMGIDIWEVLDAAATKPFGFMRFDPGPGWGGHCIPVDPFYLTWKAREHGVTSHFIELAGEVNTAMPAYVVGKVRAALNERGRPLKGARVLVLGLAYKRDVADDRESPAYEVIELLEGDGAHVDYHDPHIPEIGPTRRHGHLQGRRSVPLDEATLRSADAVVVVTDHRSVDYDMVLREAALVVDARGVLPRHPKVVRA